MTSRLTSSQTIGPFPHEGWKWGVEATAQAPQPALTISGVVLDGAGKPVDDAVLEAWVPAAAAAEDQQPIPAFRRVPSDAQGAFALPLPAPAPGEPACFVTLFARGMVKHQFCAVFLDDDAGLARSSLLTQVPEARRATLLARRSGPDAYRWDIHLQGDEETVFFDFC
jgi:protocatechuate 3,4-dioxygenase alpha subunit